MSAPLPLDLTYLGAVHTALGLIAVAAGFAALLRHGAIRRASRSGRIYLWFTLATCITGFFIFRHGGFGKPHALGVITLVVLGAAWWADRGAAARGWRPYLATLGYTLTLFFHMIPGFTETLTRLPQAQPWASGPDDPRLAQLVGAVFLAYLLLMLWQVWRLRRQNAAGAAAPAVER